MFRNKYYSMNQHNQNQILTSPTEMLIQSISQAHKKYSTSQTYYTINNINRTINNKKCKLKYLLKDIECNRQEQIIQKEYLNEEGKHNLIQLVEYYKYYTQTTIIYIPEFYKLMNQNRQRKKIVQYNKLKIQLNLSSSIQQKTQQSHKHNCTPIPSFHLISQLNKSTTKNTQESLLFQGLKKGLETLLGPSLHNSIDQIDKKYFFQKRKTTSSFNFEMFFYNKQKINVKIKQSQLQAKKSIVKFHSKRKRSCQQYTPQKTKRFPCQTKLFIKKKHLSMDNLSNLCQQNCSTPLNKKKTLKLAVYPKQNNDQKRPKKVSQATKQNVVRNNSGVFEIRQTIMGVKQKIRQQKQMLKKKVVTCSTQGDNSLNKKSRGYYNAKSYNIRGLQTHFF